MKVARANETPLPSPVVLPVRRPYDYPPAANQYRRGEFRVIHSNDGTKAGARVEMSNWGTANRRDAMGKVERGWELVCNKLPGGVTTV